MSPEWSKGDRRESREQHRKRDDGRRHFSLTPFPQSQGDVTTQGRYRHTRRKSENIYQHEEQLTPSVSAPRAQGLLLGFSELHFCPWLAGDRVFQSELLLNSVSFSSFWDDFLHKRSLSKFISRDLFYFKKKKKVYRFFSADLTSETHPVPSQIVSSVRFSMWLLFQMEPVLPQARRGPF